MFGRGSLGNPTAPAFCRGCGEPEGFRRGREVEEGQEEDMDEKVEKHGAGRGPLGEPDGWEDVVNGAVAEMLLRGWFLPLNAEPS